MARRRGSRLFDDIHAAARISSMVDLSSRGTGRLLSSPREERLEIPGEGEVIVHFVYPYDVDPDTGEGIDMPIDIRSECGD